MTSSVWVQGNTPGTELHVVVDEMPAGGSGLTDTELRATPVAVKEVRATTSAVTSVNDTATSTTLLAANADRLGAHIFNDSTAVLYIKYGATASATDYTVKLVAQAYFEVPFGYTGRIDGIWDSDAAGAARITELE